MSDNERNRVQALLESGHINEDEAEILFAALSDSEAAQVSESAVALPLTATESGSSDQTLASEPPRTDEVPALERRHPVQDETEATDPVPVPPPPPAPADVQPPEPPELPPLPSAPTEAQTGWVKLSGFCGDLVVTSDPDIGAPIVTGHATLERTDTGYLISTPPDSKGGGNWLTRLHKAAGDVQVRLPAEMGLELGVAAGDGEIRGVKTLRGTFTGGDLDVLEAETVDFTVTAGDVTLKLRPRAGEGRLKATSGDVDVIFLAGSSAVITGSATCGDLDLPSGFTRSGGFATHSFEGTLGAGEARLELRLTAGDVNIRAEDA